MHLVKAEVTTEFDVVSDSKWLQAYLDYFNTEVLIIMKWTNLPVYFNQASIIVLVVGIIKCSHLLVLPVVIVHCSNVWALGIGMHRVRRISRRFGSAEYQPFLLRFGWVKQWPKRPNRQQKWCSPNSYWTENFWNSHNTDWVNVCRNNLCYETLCLWSLSMKNNLSGYLAMT